MDWHNIIPQPKQINTSPGTWSGTFPLTITLPAAGDDALLNRINGAASRLTGVSSLFRRSSGSADVSVRGPLREDLNGGYRITIDAGGISVLYSDEESLANALAVITQGILLSHDGKTVAFPCAEINDTPTFQWRGFMLDVARHFFPLASLDRAVDYLWLLRLNRFHLHLTDDQGWRFPVSDYPLLTDKGGYRHDMTSEGGRYGGFYTAGELRQLDRDAALLGITIVPEIDLPGHASAAITAYPDLICHRAAPGVETRWGIFDSVLCASRRETFRFIEAVYTDVAETFTGRYIHIGGDEVPEKTWNDCPHCRELKNPYQTLVRAMADTVVKLGRRPVAWDEASALSLPDSTIIVNWRRPADAVEALKRGYELVLAPEGRAAYLDHKHLDSPLEPGRIGVCTVADSAAFSPATYLEGQPEYRDGALLARSGPSDPVSSGKHPSGTDSFPTGTIIGGQANLWTEGVSSHRNMEYMAWLRLAAVADGLWRDSPGGDRIDFLGDLDRLRHRLISRGINVFPGPFSDAGAGA